MKNDTDYDALYEGLQVDDDLVVKATLRVAARPLRNAVTQSLSEDWNAAFKARAAALMSDIEDVLGDHDVTAKADLIFSADGRALLKALPGSSAGATPNQPKGGKTVTPTGERKLTPSGYVHVEQPGSRGGKFWRDEKGNVRYGEKPHGNFNVPASPSDVVEHYRQYYAPQPFAAHNQLDLHNALMESNVLSNSDHAFMSWWHDNYDDILGSFKVKRKDVEKAGGLDKMVFTMADGRKVGVSEMIEEFFRANKDCFVGDPDFGNIESEEDILEAVRGLMDRYRKALHEDPKVQAYAQAEAEKREAEKNAFYLGCEQMHEEYDPLAADMVTIQDPNDLAARFVVGMHQLGLISRGSKGKVASKRMRGAITPKSSMLIDDPEKGKGDLWRDDQLERLNAAQLMSVYIATEAQESFTDDATYEWEKGLPNKNREKVFGVLAERLGITHDDTMKKSLRDNLDKTVEATLKAFNDYNTGQDPHFAELFKMKVKEVAGKSDILKQHNEKVAAEQARIEKILKAQEDTTFEVPPSMQNGIWNGKTLKDKNDPSKGVWAPFEYQKKYINWMLAAKRGVIAADAGMGKTPTVIAFREMLAAQGKDVPAICFLPPSLMEQWPSAVAKFAPDSADSILNLSGCSLEERKAALQEEMKKSPDKRAKYIFISTGTLTGDVPDPKASEDEDDGTGGSDHEMVQLLKQLDGAVFIDEAHQGGYKKAGNTRHEIAKAVMADREYAFGMTATPMPNDPMDVYHLASLFAPGSVGDQELWAGRMAGVVENKDTGSYEVSNPEHLADLNKRLKPFVFYKSINDPDVTAETQKALPERRGISDVPEEWPDEGDMAISRKGNSANGLTQHDYFKEGGIIDKMVELRLRRLIKERNEKVARGDINPDTGEPYEAYAEKMLELMAGGMQITLQRQAAISPALIDPSYAREDGGVAHSPKIRALVDDLVAHFSNGGQGGEDGKPVVVFCSYPGKAFPIVKKALAERGVDPSLIETISGEVNPSERGYMQDKLNRGHSKVLLVGTMSGGAGLNLQEAANKTLFLDEPWNPAAKRQAIGRVWRTGRTDDKPVYEKTYRLADTYDMMVEQKIAGKQAMVHALLGKELPTAETFKTDESIQALLGRVRVKGMDFSEDQIKRLMDNSSKYDLSAHEQKQAEKLLDEHWAEVASEGGRGGQGAKFTEADYQPNPEASKKLKDKGNKHLTTAFDEKEFRAKWEMDRDKRRSKQNFEIANLMNKIYSERGDKAKAEEYKKRAADLLEKYPELGGAEHAAKKNDKSGAKPKEEKSKKEAAPKNGEDKKQSEAAKPKEEKSKKPTATVKDAEEKLKGKKKLGEKPAEEEKPKQKQGEKPKNDLAAKEKTVAEPKPVEMAKPVKTNSTLGIDFHTKDNPFGETGRKIKGTDVSHGEANWLLNQLHSTRAKTWDDFMTKVIEPVWDDEGGRKPFSTEAAHEYVGKIMDAIKGQGVLSLHADKPQKKGK